MSWYFEVLKKYNVFSGRARRKEFWCFMAVNFLIYVVLYALDRAIGPFTFLPVTINGAAYPGLGIGFFSGLYALAAMYPLLSAGVRRMHDTGRSGLWLAIGLIPVAGTLALAYLLARDGQAGENQYGANPKAGQAEAAKASPPAQQNG